MAAIRSSIRRSADLFSPTLCECNLLSHIEFQSGPLLCSSWALTTPVEVSNTAATAIVVMADMRLCSITIITPIYQIHQLYQARTFLTGIQKPRCQLLRHPWGNEKAQCPLHPSSLNQYICWSAQCPAKNKQIVNMMDKEITPFLSIRRHLTKMKDDI